MESSTINTVDLEIAMEKLVFPLVSAEYRRFIVVYTALWTVLAGIPLWADYRSQWQADTLWYRSALLCLLYVVLVARMWSNQTRTLEISDEGLVLRAFLSRTKYVPWDQVNEVQLGYETLSFRLNKQVLSAIIKGSNRTAIYVSGTARHSAEIIEILRRKLPEGVFQNGSYYATQDDQQN